MINVGDYVRTKEKSFQKPQIARIVKMKKDIGYKNQYYIELDHNLLPNYEFHIYEEDIEKSSPNIMDLIEVGDYVNGLRVDAIKNNELLNSNSYDGWLCNIDIDEKIVIVTKEQFKSIKYEVRK